MVRKFLQCLQCHNDITKEGHWFCKHMNCKRRLTKIEDAVQN